jgi:hypothetical protein
LVVEKCIINKGWLVVADKDLQDAADDFADLMIDKALPLYHKLQPVVVHLFALKLQHIPSCFGVLGFNVFTVVMEVVSANKLFAAFIYFL